MADSNERKCPVCHGPITARATGRPARYCSDNCRQAAHRERAREAKAARQLAADLANAKATMQRLFRPMEETSHEVAELAGEVFGTAADPGRDPAALAKALAAFAWAAQRLERYALDYQDADNTVAVLSLVKAAVRT
jgi:predicted nucleic acid-binding Zn ribbon protein